MPYQISPEQLATGNCQGPHVTDVLHAAIVQRLDWTCVPSATGSLWGSRGIQPWTIGLSRPKHVWCASHTRWSHWSPGCRSPTLGQSLLTRLQQLSNHKRAYRRHERRWHLPKCRTHSCQTPAGHLEERTKVTTWLHQRKIEPSDSHSWCG